MDPTWSGQQLDDAKLAAQERLQEQGWSTVPDIKQRDSGEFYGNLTTSYFLVNLVRPWFSVEFQENESLRFTQCGSM